MRVNWGAVIVRFVLPCDLLAIDAARDFDFLVRRLAAAGEFVVGLNELAVLIAFVSSNVVVDGPLAGKTGRS